MDTRMTISLPQSLLRILLVEDDRVDELSFRRAIAKDGLPYEVISAASVPEAEALLASRPFDVIVTDYSLGGRTAFDLSRQAHGVPWIIMTGMGDEGVAVAALRAGAQDYIVKKTDGSHLKVLPFSIEATVNFAKANQTIRMLSQAARSVRDAVYITDLQGRFLFTNAAFEALYGYSSSALADMTSALLEAPVPSDSQEAAAEGEVEVFHCRQDGSPFPVWLSVSTVNDEDGAPTAIVHVSRDMTERRQEADRLRRANQDLARANEELETARRALEELAIRDELTGLYNRRELNRLLDDEVARSERSGHPLSLVLIDVDHFKQVNDDFGHLAGDEVLRGLGKVLHGALRRIDRAARFGGEELAILLTETPDFEAMKVAERLRLHIAKTPFQVKDRDGAETQLFVTVSLGIATRDGTPRTAQDLLRRADQALYRAKAEGRNKAICLDPFSEGRARAITRPLRTA